MSDEREDGGAAAAKLRGHHLMCQQFYLGQGRPAEFSKNLLRVVAAAQTMPATLVAGADDLCASCDCLDSKGVCRDPHAGEPEISRLDELALELLGASVGGALSFDEARERLIADTNAISRWREEACDRCSADVVCSPGWRRLRRQTRGAGTDA